MKFERDTAKTMLAFAALAYENDSIAEAGCQALGYGNFRAFSGPSTQAISATANGTRVLAFRGTEANPLDWIRDAQFLPRTGEFGEQVHSGFHFALNEVWDEVADAVGRPEELHITGHSLGAGLAVLAAARVVEAGGSVSAVYTFGSPRVGRRGFRDKYNAVLGDRTFRFINHIDLVTRVALMLQGYSHVGARMYFDGSGRLHEHAPSWKVIIDDVLFRLRHFGTLKSAGLDPHFMPAYRRLLDAL